MPSAKKVAWSQLKVGIMALVSMVLLAILVFLITGSRSFFSEKVQVYTYMSDSAALATGAAVRLNGILIGSVREVVLSGEADKERTVRVRMEIERKMLSQIPADSIAAIASENVLGSKFINIRRGDATARLVPDGELKSKDTSEFDDVIATGYTLLSSLQGILKRIDAIVSIVEAGKGSIGKLLTDEELYNNLNRTVAEVREITEVINSGKGTIGKLMYDDAIFQDTRGAIQRVNVLLEGLEQGQGTAGKLLKDPALYDELRKTNAEVRTLLADLNAGKGTAGKLLKDDEMHKQLMATMGRLDTLLGKINSGEGTLGQLVVNPQLYESLNGFTREMNGFMKDFRANPKKFLSIKLGLF